MENFESLGLSESILKTIKAKGFEEPTPIQQKTIPAILTGKKDIVAQAQTGTGKTAAFGLPLIEKLVEKSHHVQALILAPTRELAIQVAEEINSLKGKKQLNVFPIYGGQSIEFQLKNLKRGTDIVVGTPGRIIDHLKRKSLVLKNISYMVLDEADEMLNMGFLEDVELIMENTSKEKRTMLFSATMPDEILQLAKKYMKEFDIFKVNQNQFTVSQTDQIYFEVSSADKFEALCRIIDIEDDFYGLVFCRTKVDVDTISTHLNERGYGTDALHGDISQNLREKILDKFKKKKIQILVATDVAARGIDIHNLTHVINYSLPHDSEAYIHRIGRTGRAGREGIAITFVTPGEYRKLQFIMRKFKTNIRKESLPKVKDLIKVKKQRIKADILENLKTDAQKEYLEMSHEILQDADPADIIASLLQSFYKDELDESKYTELENTKPDLKGKTRLFVTKGRQDGFSPGKLIEFIQQKTKISKNDIRDIQILDKFSFVTLPFHEAELLLADFKKGKIRSGFNIKKAKAKN